MKKCTRCGKVTDQFHKLKRSPDGLQPRCIPCAKEIAKVRYQTNRQRIDQINRDREQEYLRQYREYKMTLSCVDCGVSDWRVLEFDHVNGDKKANVSNMASKMSLKGLMREISKCEVVCANCHRIRTHERRVAG